MLIFFSASSVLAQPEQTRGGASPFEHDFSVVSGDSESFTFEYKNKSKSVLKVIDVELPEQLSITLLSKKVRPSGSLEIVVVADPEVMSSGKFNSNIVVTVQQNQPGIKTTKTITFNVKGSIE